MPADAEPRRALAVVAPRVEGGDRHAEVLGEIFHGVQLVAVFHGPILYWNPLSRVSGTLQLDGHRSRNRYRDAENREPTKPLPRNGLEGSRKGFCKGFCNSGERVRRDTYPHETCRACRPRRCRAPGVSWGGPVIWRERPSVALRLACGLGRDYEDATGRPEPNGRAGADAGQPPDDRLAAKDQRHQSEGGDPMPSTPTAPERSHRAPGHAPPRHQRDRRRTPFTTTRTCNKLRAVYPYTGEVR